MKNYIESATQILFVILATILIVLITLGINQDFSAIHTTEFWITAFSQLCFTMIIFNIARNISKKNHTHDKLSRFFKAYATNVLRIKEIEKRKLYDELDKAVALKNKEMLIKKCNIKLHRLCTRVNYEDVISEEPITYIINTFKVCKKRQKKFTKLVTKIRAGKIRIRKLVADIFLQDKELIFDTPETYDYSNIVNEVWLNAKKAVTFLICSIISATITFAFNSPNFWTTLVTNFTLFLGATMSGFKIATREIKRKTALYERRNIFLHKYLDLTVEYVYTEE